MIKEIKSTGILLIVFFHIYIYIDKASIINKMCYTNVLLVI